MSNKLEQHKQKQSSEGTLSQYTSEKAEGFREGFNAVLALDLPVKFLNWYTEEQNKCADSIAYHDQPKPYAGLDRKGVYKYWIENIYKPE